MGFWEELGNGSSKERGRSMLRDPEGMLGQMKNTRFKKSGWYEKKHTKVVAFLFVL